MRSIVLEQMKEMVGDPKKEKEFLEEWSPSNHADKIKAPVFRVMYHKSLNHFIQQKRRARDLDLRCVVQLSKRWVAQFTSRMNRPVGQEL